MSDYKKVKLRTFAPLEERETPEARFWRKFKYPVVHKLVAHPSCVNFCPTTPHDYAVTTGARVIMYDYKTHREKRVFSKFKEDVFSGAFRGDGRLLAAGGSRGIVHALDVATRAELRQFRGHRGPVRVTQFAPDGGVHLLSAGDDRSVRCWDLATGKALATVEKAHGDYIRCAGGSAAAGAVWATGSYDHTVRLWDVRSLGEGSGSGSSASSSSLGALLAGGEDEEGEDEEGGGGGAAMDEDGEGEGVPGDGEVDAGDSEAGGGGEGEEEEEEDGSDELPPVATAGGLGGRAPAARNATPSQSAAAAGAPASSEPLPRGCVLSVSHGEPVTQVLMLPGGGLLLTAGGTTLKLWDLVAGGRLLHEASHHTKLVTSLALDGTASRILSGGLDGAVKVYETGSFGVTHTMRYDSPVLALGCSPDNTRLVVGLADSTLIVKQRLLQVATVVSEARSARVLRGGSYRYFLRGQAATAHAEDVLVELGGAKQRLAAHDAALKRFEYGAALDAALATGNPAVVTSLIEELVARQGLVRALGGRGSEAALSPLLAFLAKHVADPRYAGLLLDVASVVLDMYGGVIGTSAAIDGLFGRLAGRLRDEARLARELLALQGSLDMLMAAAASTSSSPSASSAAAPAAAPGSVTGARW